MLQNSIYNYYLHHIYLYYPLFVQSLFRLHGENYAFETEAVTLEPGEAYSVDISIPYPVARQDGTNNVKITATTGDTTATYKESFTH